MNRRLNLVSETARPLSEGNFRLAVSNDKDYTDLRMKKLKVHLGGAVWEEFEKHNPLLHGQLEDDLLQRSKITRSLVVGLRSWIKL